MKRSVILLPTYNERDNVGLILKEIFTAHPDIHVVVIDDSSPDGTGDIVRQLTRTYPNLSLVSRAMKEGLGVAYKAGIRTVLDKPENDYVIMMDADGSHGVEYIADLLTAIEYNDFVIASRYATGGAVENWETWRHGLSYWGNTYARLLTGLPVRDLTAGFYCIRRSLLEQMDLNMLTSSGYAFQIDIKFHAYERGARLAEIPIVFKQRREGESKLSRHIIREGLLSPLRILRKRLSI